MLKRTRLTFLLSFFVVVAMAQQPSGYRPFDAFSPDFYPPSVNEYRSADGSPGPKYFTNNASYDIEASLDTVANRVSGTVLISYTNNSPQNLHYVWLQLDQNLFTQHSRGQAKMPATGSSRYGDAGSTFDGGFKFESVKVVSGEKGKVTEENADTLIDDTRMQIRLKKPIAANGGKIQFKLKYSFIVPNEGSDRMGIEPTRHGRIYAIAQWYPRMSVYDDIKGWNTLPYLGAGEFYLEYGDYNVKITAPANMAVVGAGDLVNAKQVLSATEFKRFEAAKKSEETVFIRTVDEVQKGAFAQKGTKTWQFKIQNSRDFAWAASAAFIWDGAKINLTDNKTALAMSVYPVESYGKNGWERSTEYTKASIEGYSKRWANYPYTSAVNVACNVNGMEYPAIVFCNSRSRGGSLWGVTDHEFGHTWFPMMVGSNEREHGWLDEGLNTFINDISTSEFNNGEYMHTQRLARTLFPYMFAPQSEVVMSMPDALKEMNIAFAVYYKPGYALNLLRDHILGPDRFDYAFRQYIERWSYKHPTPTDFFRTIENAAGEDLAWFWRGLFVHNWRLDQAITDVKYINNNPENGALVTIKNLDKMVMPIYLQYTTAGGKTSMEKIPVEVWQNGDTWIQRLKTTEPLKSVMIDPAQVFPDVNPANNRWTEK